ncbi:MAG: class I SAM-dependent methyltransferase [Bryobacteraceae bacterium]
MTRQIICAACEATDPEIVVIGGVRRTSCRHCHHSQRIDIEPFDYTRVAMGSTGIAAERLKGQADFIVTRLSDAARALEIGCAAGDLAQALRERRSFATYDGVELSPARQRAAERLDHVFDAPLQSLLASGSIEEASYDVVLSSHCLEHLDDPSATIAAMRRALKPDGLMFIETPNRSGHARLPFDDNRSHIHFFGVLSLTRLLARHGLETVAVETGARLDARYSDSVRVLARAHAAPVVESRLLSDHPKLAGVDKLVVWGAGRMVEEMLEHYFDPQRIAFFIDKDERKHGTLRFGAPVRGPDALAQGANWIVLVNLLEMESAIRAEIAATHSARVARVVSVSELLDS